MAEIYALIDPVTDEVRYIGKANDSVMRLKSHIRDAKRRDYPVYRWINKLIGNGLMPIVKVLAITDNWQEEEKRIIKHHKEIGCKLLNVAEGGDQPYCSIEQRKKNGANIVNNIKNKRLWKL